MTHGHKLKVGGGRECWWEGVTGQRGIKGKKWETCNHIINKMCFKNFLKENYIGRIFTVGNIWDFGSEEKDGAKVEEW